MKFDHTHGAEPKYIVSIYGQVHDQHYYSSYKEAKACFNEMKKTPLPTGTILSVYDMKNDIRKEFVRF